MLSSVEIAKRRQFYREVFGNQQIASIMNLKPHLWAVNKYEEKIRGLEERGFNDPHKMIIRSPTILGFSLGNIDKKIEGLKERGFNDPHKMVMQFPVILRLSFENIDKKIEGIKELGFNDPLPTIFGFSTENIDKKIRGLKERGFNDPHKMIIRSPAILRLSFENIDKKIRKARRLDVDIDAFIAYNFTFIGMSAKNYVPILRKCRRLGLEPTPTNVMKIYKNKSYKSPNQQN